MSQWGLERWFKRGDTKIQVIAHVDTPLCWHPIKESYLVDKLQLIAEIGGTQGEAEQMLAQLKSCYEGKPYSLWCEPVMTEM